MVREAYRETAVRSGLVRGGTGPTANRCGNIRGGQDKVRPSRRAAAVNCDQSTRCRVIPIDQQRARLADACCILTVDDGSWTFVF